MSDPMEPEPRPKKKSAPLPGEIGSPLPRLWKVEPEADSEEVRALEKEAKRKKKADAKDAASKSSNAGPGLFAKKSSTKKKSKDGKAKAAKDGEPKGVLVEETPNMDTYESRRRVRIIIGSAITAVFLLIGFLIFRSVSSTPPVEDTSQDDLLTQVNQKASVSRERDETEAKALLVRAKEVAKNGKVEMAISFLTNVTKKYPATQAAREANDALERPSKNLPLFPDRPVLLAVAGTPNGNANGSTNAANAPGSPKPAPTNASGAGADIGIPPPTAPAASNETMPAPPSATSPPAPALPTNSERPSKPLPVGFHKRPGTDIDESGWPYEIIGERDDSTLVLVPGGIFIQGRDDADANEAPSHEVKLSTYYIDKHEVTNRQFERFQRDAGRRSERARALATLKESGKSEIKGAVVETKDEFPAVMVSAKDAKAYADWADKSLPTEAQWEVAGRTSDARIYPWGPTPPAWSKPRQPRQIDLVMSYPEDDSPYGVFDLSGNVWEWTKDWFDAHYYQQFKNGTAENPIGPPTSPRVKQLVVKGTGKDWSLSRREGLKIETRLPYLGFRCVLQVEGPGNAFEPKVKPAAPNQGIPPGQQNNGLPGMGAPIGGDGIGDGGAPF